MSRHRKESLAARGARFELVVISDLMRQGFAIFRPVSADGPVDAIGIKRGQIVALASQAALFLGRKGGSAKSKAKTKASRS